MAAISGIIDKAMAALDRGLLALEEKYTLFGTSLVFAFLLMAAAAVYVRPTFFPWYHGIYYSQLAEHPFQAANPNGYRLLTPLIAYLVGLRGDRIIILNLFVALILLIVVYYHSRRQEYAPSLALAVTMMLALTMPTLFTIYYGGYTDSTSYLLIFLMLVCGRRPVLFWLLFLLGLLNRESVVFLLPFFALWHWQSLKSSRIFIRSIIIGPVATIILYLLCRAAINTQTVVGHSGTFYFAPLFKDPFFWLRQVARAYPLGVYSAFKLCWVLPIAAVLLAVREHRYMMVALVLTPVLFSAAQSFIALDTSRMLAMAFPSLLMAVIVLRVRFGDRRLGACVFLLVLLSVALPQVYVTSNEVMWMRSSLSLLSGSSTESGRASGNRASSRPRVPDSPRPPFAPDALRATWRLPRAGPYSLRQPARGPFPPRDGL